MAKNNFFPFSLSLDNSFYSIKTVNISNSKISVTANNCPVKDFIARNVKGYAKIELVDCKSLQNLPDILDMNINDKVEMKGIFEGIKFSEEKIDEDNIILKCSKNIKWK